MRSGTTSIAPAVFLFLFGWLALTAAAQAQYPSRMVKAIVPYTPGSSADLIARNLGPRLSEGWKVPFVVDNRAGASGIIGVQAVVGAPGDGYTVLIMADNFASAASVRPSSYDPVNDLDPVILLARGDYALMASASFPAKSVAELVGMARANPGKIYYASPGSGLPAHLMMEVFKSTMGIDLVHVPYKNNAAAVTDLVGGQVSLMFASVGVALPLAEGGRIRILAAGAAKRAARTPEVPSFIESGVKDFNVGTWFAMLVPKGTPREVRAKLHADIAALLKEPAVAELMRRIRLGGDRADEAPARRGARCGAGDLLFDRRHAAAEPAEERARDPAAGRARRSGALRDPARVQAGPGRRGDHQGPRERVLRHAARRAPHAARREERHRVRREHVGLRARVRGRRVQIGRAHV